MAVLKIASKQEKNVTLETIFGEALRFSWTDLESHHPEGARWYLGTEYTPDTEYSEDRQKDLPQDPGPELGPFGD